MPTSAWDRTCLFSGNTTSGRDGHQLPLELGGGPMSTTRTNAVLGGSSPSCSTNYFQNTNLLSTQWSQTAGGSPGGFSPLQTYQASLSCTLVFTNGSSPKPIRRQRLIQRCTGLAGWISRAGRRRDHCRLTRISMMKTVPSLLFSGCRTEGVNSSEFDAGIRFPLSRVYRWAGTVGPTNSYLPKSGLLHETSRFNQC